ncbi:S49 family peptidase [Spirosoma agri]|nr:S49 family peptidase [Spirosoma agri]
MRQIIQPRLEAGKDAIPANLLNVNPSIDAKLSRSEQYVADYFRLDSGVAVLPINGAMSREGGMCSYGNETLMRWLDILSRDDNTVAAVLKTNSPGGTVDSTRAFADAVKNFGKPIIGWTPFAASAAYFVLSQCTEIFVEDQLIGGVGSIGVLMILVNQAKSLEMQGFDVQILRAEGSQDKALINGIEPISDQTLAEIQTTLNACRNEFVGYVRRGRAGKITSNEVYTGKMYTPADSIRLGLADRKGSLSQAIQRAVQLSK